MGRVLNPDRARASSTGAALGLAGLAVLFAICLGAGLAGATAGVAWATHNAHSIVLGVVGHPGAAATVASLALGFIFFRGLVLWRAARDSKIDLPLWDACTGFSEGVAIECIFWPGKLWGDAYRWCLPASARWRDRTRMLVRFRLATTVAWTFTLAASAAMAAGNWWGRWGAAATVIAALLAGSLWHWTHGLTSREPGRWVATIMLATAASVCDLGGAAVAAWAIAGINPLSFAVMHVLISAAGAASMLPLGVGVVDAGLWLVLTQSFKVDSVTAGTVVLVYRCCGPGVTLVVGAVSFLRRMFKPQGAAWLAGLFDRLKHARDHFNSVPSWQRWNGRIAKNGAVR